MISRMALVVSLTTSMFEGFTYLLEYRKGRLQIRVAVEMVGVEAVTRVVPAMINKFRLKLRFFNEIQIRSGLVFCR